MIRHRNWLCMGLLMGSLACSSARLQMGFERDSGADDSAGGNTGTPSLASGADAAPGTVTNTGSTNAPGAGSDAATGGNTAVLDAAAEDTPGSPTTNFDAPPKPVTPAMVLPSLNSLSFGTVTVGLSRVRTLTVRNSETETSGPLVLEISNPAFTLRTGVPGDCAPGMVLKMSETCTLAVIFSPEKGQDFSAYLTIKPVPGNVDAVSLSGMGQSGTLSVLAGAISGQGNTDGTGSTARFGNPRSVASNAAGTLFVMDGPAIIRKITLEGLVTTLEVHAVGDNTDWGSPVPFGPLAVSPSGDLFVADISHGIWRVTSDGIATLFAGRAGASGAADGVGTAALFYLPKALVADAAGNLFVADTGNHAIRKITPEGVVTTYAGTLEVAGDIDGPAKDAKFNSPSALAIDAAGNLYVGHDSSPNIRKITPAGVVTTILGSETSQFERGMAVDRAGDLFVTDGSTIVRYTSAGVRSVFAGNPSAGGSSDGTGASARFLGPISLTFNPAGDLFAADPVGHVIRKITPAGVVTTFAGLSDAPGSADGSAADARFHFSSQMVGIVMDDSGNIIIPDVANHTIRKLSRAGVVTTLAGTPGVAGATDGAGADAHFREPTGLALDKAGNLYVADTGNHTIRKVTPKGVVTTLAGTPGKGGREDGQGAAASFQSPEGIAVDASGTLFVVDVFYSNIRRISPEGLVTTPAWQTADRALFCITGITIDEAGNLYASDHCNYAIHKITPAGEVTTLAGGGPLPGGGKDGVGAAARFSWPAGLAVDDAGNVFVADFGNDAIRRVTPTGVVSTVVGALASTNYGNFPGPLPASLVHPVGVAVDPATSRLFIVLPDAIMTVGP